MPAITRPQAPAQAFNLANGIHADLGRVHAVPMQRQRSSRSIERSQLAIVQAGFPVPVVELALPINSKQPQDTGE